MNRIMNYTELL